MMKTTCVALMALLMMSVPATADVAIGEPDHEIEQRPVDPFLPLIQPAKAPAEIVKNDGPIVVLPPPPVVIPPVQFSVLALAVDGPQAVAVVEFQGQTYIVQKGSKIPETGTPAMEVTSVSEEKVVVQDTRLMRLVTKQIAE